jgi:hypothetical protein
MLRNLEGMGAAALMLSGNPLHPTPMDTDHRTSETMHVLACADCPRVSSAGARGWKAYRTDDPWELEPTALAFYCPDCARRAFGTPRR